MYVPIYIHAKETSSGLLNAHLETRTREPYKQEIEDRAQWLSRTQYKSEATARFLLYVRTHTRTVYTHSSHVCILSRGTTATRMGTCVRHRYGKSHRP